MIDGLLCTPLVPQFDDNGILLPVEVMAGEAGQSLLFSNTFPGKTRAWQQADTTQQLVCSSGLIRLACFDARQDSSSFGAIQEFFCGDQALQMLQIPPGVIYGWKSLAAPGAAVVQCFGNSDYSVTPHAADTHLIPYIW